MNSNSWSMDIYRYINSKQLYNIQTHIYNIPPQATTTWPQLRASSLTHSLSPHRRWWTWMTCIFCRFGFKMVLIPGQIRYAGSQISRFPSLSLPHFLSLSLSIHANKNIYIYIPFSFVFFFSFLISAGQ